MGIFKKLFGASLEPASEPASEEDRFLRDLRQLKVMDPPTSFKAWKDQNSNFTVVKSRASATDVIHLIKSKLGGGAGLPDLHLTNQIFGFRVEGLQRFESKGNARYLTGKFGVVRVSSSYSDPDALLKGNMYTDKTSRIYIFRYGNDQFMCVREDNETTHRAEW
jgi:hypothetical protein